MIDFNGYKIQVISSANMLIEGERAEILAEMMIDLKNNNNKITNRYAELYRELRDLPIEE